MTTLAFLRPDDWDFPLFLHVLGAVVLFGAVASAGLLGLTSLRRSGPTALMLRRLTFRTVWIVVWPSFILMRVAGQWIAAKEFSDTPEPDWIGVGYVVGDGGILVLAVLTLCAWLAVRQTNDTRTKPATATIATGVAGFYLLALAVAWLVMTVKPGS